MSKENYGEKYGKFNENVKVEWTCPYGPEKGKRISAWFYSEESAVKHLIDDLDGKIIDRV